MLVASAAVLFTRVERTRFDGDESGWIASCLHYTDLLRRGDFRWKGWRCAECHAWGWLNPPLGKFLIGIPLRLSRPSDPDFRAYYMWGSSYEENQRLGHVPPADMLRVARRTAASFGVLCCLLVLALGWRTLSPATGLLGAGLLLTSSRFVASVTRAITDAYYLFFLLALCLACLRLLGPRGRLGPTAVAALCGVLAGLATSVKITGFFVGGVLFLACAVYAARVHHHGWRTLLRQTVAFAGAVLIVVYALNPYFWPTFEGVTPGSVAREGGALAREVASGELERPTLAQRYPALADLAHVLEFPLLSRRWNSYMESQQRAFERARWPGPRLLVIHRQLPPWPVHRQFPPWPGVWSALWGLFLVVGALLCARRVWKGLRSGAASPAAVPLFHFLVQYALLLLFLKMPWGRYYLAAGVAGTLLVAEGIVEGVRLAARRNPAATLAGAPETSS